jgi:hypothetical protein
MGGAGLFHRDRQTDRHDKANGHLSQFCKHLKINTYEMVEIFQEDVWCIEGLTVS